jgi:hypothetical protein
MFFISTWVLTPSIPEKFYENFSGKFPGKVFISCGRLLNRRQNVFLSPPWVPPPFSGKVLLPSQVYITRANTFYSTSSSPFTKGIRKTLFKRPKTSVLDPQGGPPELQVPAPLVEELLPSSKAKGSSPSHINTFHPKTTLKLKSSMMGLSMLDTWLAGTVAHAFNVKHAGVIRQRTVWTTGKTH